MTGNGRQPGAASDGRLDPATHWQRRKLAQGIVLILIGVTMVVVGSIWAGTEAGGATMNGIWLGTAGVLILVVGALFAKWGIVGPLPQGMQQRSLLEEND